MKLGTIDGGQYTSASLFPSCGDSTQLRYSLHRQKRGKSRRVAAHSQQRNGGNARLKCNDPVEKEERRAVWEICAWVKVEQGNLR